MWSFLRRQFLYFLTGFVVAFVIYIFARFDSDKVLLGVLISALVGLVVSAVIMYLERKFPERRPPA
jgi:ABC-type nitrate/sulfonate/bicarbonate transport system permease component